MVRVRRRLSLASHCDRSWLAADRWNLLFGLVGSLPVCLLCRTFSHTLVHVPGKLLYTADTLSRAPLDSLIDVAKEEVEDFSPGVVAALSAGPDIRRYLIMRGGIQSVSMVKLSPNRYG